MPKTKLTWNGAKFLALLRAEIKKRIYACVIAVQNHAKKLLGVEGAGSAGKGKRLKYGFRRSSPGKPPYKQSGRLQSGVASEVAENGGNPAGRVGTNVKYGRALELGAETTRDTVFGKKVKPFHWVLKARPWLRRALKEMIPFIQSVMGRPMKF
jgi:phage gpG-like protein